MSACPMTNFEFEAMKYEGGVDFFSCIHLLFILLIYLLSREKRGIL